MNNIEELARELQYEDYPPGDLSWYGISEEKRRAYLAKAGRILRRLGW